MKKAFLTYVLTLVVILGGLMQLHANSLEGGHHLTINHELNSNASSFLSTKQFLPSSSNIILKLKKVFAEPTENEEINTSKKNQVTFLHGTISNLFLHSFFTSTILDLEELTLGCNKPLKAFSYKRYIKFEVFRI